MSDLKLDLDPELLRALAREMEHDAQRGRFRLGAGCTYVLDGCSGDAARNDLVSTLKHKLERYIDFDAGGLKLVEVPLQGGKATFSVAPGWSAGPETGTRGMGGPSITFKFHMRF